MCWKAFKQFMGSRPERAIPSCERPRPVVSTSLPPLSATPAFDRRRYAARLDPHRPREGGRGAQRAGRRLRAVHGGAQAPSGLCDRGADQLRSIVRRKVRNSYP
jgi:hypothetical protein